jgi:hypothetical protein
VHLAPNARVSVLKHGLPDLVALDWIIEYYERKVDSSTVPA